MAKPLLRWPPADPRQAEAKLKSLKDDLESFDATTSEGLASWMAQLLVVKSAGYVEQTALACARAHISTLAIGTVRSYGLARIENYFGPKPGQLQAFVARFDPAWEQELAQRLDDDDERLRRGLTQLLADRDQIAHGRSHSVGRVKALEHYKTAIEVADWCVLRLNPLTSSS